MIETIKYQDGSFELNSKNEIGEYHGTMKYFNKNGNLYLCGIKNRGLWHNIIKSWNMDFSINSFATHKSSVLETGIMVYFNYI